MDSNTKMRKGFMKGKMGMAFYRASKPSTPIQPYTTTIKSVKTSPTTQLKPASAISQKTTMPPTSLIMNQEKVNPQPKQKVTYIIPQTTGTYGVFDNPYGVAVDEGVDAKASVYISCVQERFRLEHVTTELMEQAS